MSERHRVPRVRRRPRSLPVAGRGPAVVVAVVVLVVTAALIGGRQGSDSSTSSETTGGTEGFAASGDQAPPTTVMASGERSSADAAGSAEAQGATDSGSSGLPGVAPDAAKIVRTGAVEVELADGTFADGVRRLSTIAAGSGGYVSASETAQLGDDPQGTVTVRIPAAGFDRAVEQISALGTVVAVTTGSQDVTGEYTDTTTRIAALEAERDQIELVLGRAETIPDILAVRDRLTVVQSDLEQLQGRQQVLDDQTSLSTITVTLREEGAASLGYQPTDERSGLARVWHDAADRFTDGAADIAVGLGALGPWLLLLAVAWLPGRWLIRRLTTVAAPDDATPGSPATAAP